MSAFLVGNTTINKILTEVKKSARHSPFFKTKMEEEFLIDFSNPEWQTQLGQKMLDLNQEALGYRYGDPKQNLTYTFQSVYSTKIEAIKALQCWLYQGAEGDIPETAELYKFFDSYVIARWTMDVVRQPRSMKKRNGGNPE